MMRWLCIYSASKFVFISFHLTEKKKCALLIFSSLPLSFIHNRKRMSVALKLANSMDDLRNDFNQVWMRWNIWTLTWNIHVTNFFFSIFLCHWFLDLVAHTYTYTHTTQGQTEIDLFFNDYRFFLLRLTNERCAACKNRRNINNQTLETTFMWIGDAKSVLLVNMQ